MDKTTVGQAVPFQHYDYEEDFNLFQGGNVGELGVTLLKPGSTLEGIRWVDSPQGGGFRAMLGKLYDIGKPKAGAVPLRAFQLELHGARVLAADTRNNVPVLIEHSLLYQRPFEVFSEGI